MLRVLTSRRPSPSMMVAMMALIVATGGTSYAAMELPKNSVGTKQIKQNAVTGAKVRDGSLVSRDFAAGQIPQGPKGDQGPAGPSKVYTKLFPTKMVTNGQFQFAALTLPAGSYFVTVRANAANAGPAVTRLECVLNEVAHPDPAFDFFKTGLGVPANYPQQFGALSMTGAAVLPTGGVVQATCGSVADTEIELITARMTAVKVDAVETQ